MKIVFLCRLFYPHIGGVEKHVMKLSERLIKKGHSVTVITERFEKKLPEKEIVNGITVYRIDVGGEDRYKKFRIWKEIVKLKKIVVEADIIHCHDVFFWYLPFRLLYLHKPVYTTFHGYESYPIKKSAIRMRKISEKLSWGNICIGDFISKWYGTKPTFVSYGAVESANFKVQKAKYNKESALFFGRIDEQTGVLAYTQVVELVRKKYPKFRLTIIGDGKDKKKIGKEFKVLGFQRDPEKQFPNYHFAFVSRYLSILEAFATKRLVFAVYDNPVKEDYLKMAPYAKNIIIANTLEQLAKEIIYYLENPSKEKELVERAYSWVQKQTWDNMVALYLQLWNNR